MTPQRFKEIIEDAGYETMSYSGRGMFGKECIAVRIERESESAIAFTANIMAAVDDKDERDELVKIFQRCAMDSLGLDEVLYFPKIEWIE